MTDTYSLDFTQLLRYDPGDAGVTLEATLGLGVAIVTVKAKVDTGSTYCVFERAHDEV